jgi:hypothetical protein
MWHGVLVLIDLMHLNDQAALTMGEPQLYEAMREMNFQSIGSILESQLCHLYYELPEETIPVPLERLQTKIAELNPKQLHLGAASYRCFLIPEAAMPNGARRNPRPDLTLAL